MESHIGGTIIDDHRDVLSIFDRDVPAKLKKEKRYGRVRFSEALRILYKSNAIRKMFEDFYAVTIELDHVKKIYTLLCYSKHFKKCKDMDNPVLYSLIFQNTPDEDGRVHKILHSVKKSVIQ